MMHIDNFQDFIKAHADAAGMTREEFMAVLMSENTTIQEGLSKSAIKKQIKVIDKQIEDEEGGDGEPLTSETLQDLERERERLLALIESVVTESKNSKEIKELEKLLKSIKSNTPADQGRKASIQDDIERLKNEAVTESKLHESMTIAQKFKALM